MSGQYTVRSTNRALDHKKMYEGDSLEMLECEIPFSESKKCIDSPNTVIEMIVASFPKHEKLSALMSFQKSHKAEASIAIVAQVFAFCCCFFIVVTEKHVFYGL